MNFAVFGDNLYKPSSLRRRHFLGCEPFGSTEPTIARKGTLQSMPSARFSISDRPLHKPHHLTMISQELAPANGLLQRFDVASTFSSSCYLPKGPFKNVSLSSNKTSVLWTIIIAEKLSVAHITHVTDMVACSRWARVRQKAGLGDLLADARDAGDARDASSASRCLPTIA